MSPIRFSDESLSFEVLSHENAGLLAHSDFDCGDPDLNEFIKTDARNHQAGKIAQTYLLIQGTKIVCYFCLSTDSIQLGESESRKFRSKGFGYPSFPALKIGRLAVAKEFQRAGIGRMAVLAAQGAASNVQAFAGCRFLTVDAKPGAFGFWERLGFNRNLKENLRARETESMRFDLHVPEKPCCLV